MARHVFGSLLLLGALLLLAAANKEDNVLHIGGIFPIMGEGGWQGGQVSDCFFMCVSEGLENEYRIRSQLSPIVSASLLFLNEMQPCISAHSLVSRRERE